ncbi:uncharacterized protein LOC110032083 [Phalaenopsis equestris]|uniref:uncharacterized protein LOC110032083 n=1 Tax=Phalaenopsis equestris TaxID=78828 RepID=UPI0009E36663|nr:uncharacterized protein LOC110032083 [Phalaenopsis equestris]
MATFRGFRTPVDLLTGQQGGQKKLPSVPSLLVLQRFGRTSLHMRGRLLRPHLLGLDRRNSKMPANSPSFIRQALTSSSCPRVFILLSASLLLFYILVSYSSPFYSSAFVSSSSPFSNTATTSPGHLLFGIAASSRTWPRRSDYVRTWWRSGITRGIVFLDSIPQSSSSDDRDIPPLRISADTSSLPYSFKGGKRSAIRVARIAKELFDAFDGKLAYGDFRWIVLGDDDTIFFLENLAGTLAKYDWEQWYYVGSYSESAEQNAEHFFEMAFGGGGFAISYPLAKVLSKVMDSCLIRYAHLFGSDARVFACLAELGVGLTREPGFHQVDLRGDLFGLLSTHPLPPLVSLHHLDSVDPLFPGKNHSESLRHLLKATTIDPERILQQTVCYDRNDLRTVSISWGFAVQIFEGNVLITDLLSLQKTFRPWRRGRTATSGVYMFNTREFPRDPCKRPAIFFLESLHSSASRTESNYSRQVSVNCPGNIVSTQKLQRISVFSENYGIGIRKAVRRRCCDVLDSSHEAVMNVNIRKCRDDELIAMHP